MTSGGYTGILRIGIFILFALSSAIEVSGSSKHVVSMNPYADQLAMMVAEPGQLTSLVLNLSPNPFAALEIVFWLMGSPADRSMVHVHLAAPFIIVSAVLLLSLGRSLNALTLGDQVATTLGVNASRLQLLTIFGTACGVGAATSVSGAIGFAGLVVPHILRPLTGSMPSRLLFASAIGGAVLVLAADVFVRVVFAERELKLGVVTALIGAPFFLWLLMKHRKAIL